MVPCRFPLEAGPVATLDAAPVLDAAPAGVVSTIAPRRPARRAAAAAPAGTVVLVPGYTGSKEDFLPLLRPLADAGHRAVAYDQRGQYESPGPEDATAYSVVALADELLEVIDALDDGPVHVVGHSFGGLVARGAALARTSAFASLTLLDSGPGAITGPRAAMIGLLRPVLDAQGQPEVWRRMTELAAAAGVPPSPPEVAEFLERRFVTSSAAGLRAMADALRTEPDRVSELARTGLALLVAHGEHDDAWPPVVQAEMARRLGACHEVIPAAAHSPNVEAPEATAAALLRFFAMVEARAA